MSDTTQTNAMAEIALALAMGFFSIMVLTLVSMGSGLVVSEVKEMKETPIQMAKTSDEPASQASGAAQTPVEPEDLVIFHEGRFFDDQLQPIEKSAIEARSKVILAVSPDLSMSKTMSVREGFQVEDLTVIVLNDAWLTALKEVN